MSLRALRRSLIATAAVGGSLALAASAFAIPVPIGNSNDAPYSGTGKPASVYSLYNAATAGLIQAQNLIVGANAVASLNSTTPVDSNFTTNFTKASDLTTANVAEIATDISKSANAFDLEAALCISTEEAAGTPQGTAVSDCDTPPTVKAPYPATFTGTIQAQVAGAAASWPNLATLIQFLGPASGTMYSADSGTVSSSGTVVSPQAPMAYDVKLSAPAGGYIVPGVTQANSSTTAFSLSFPAGLSVNTSLVGAEINAAANGTSAAAIAAVEANPPASATSIGTVTATSPLANEFGGSNNQLVGKIYVVQTGQSSGQGSVTQPYLELWFAPGFYELGSFPSTLAFPLKLTFGEILVPGLGYEPLPINSIDMSFPAATSPVKSSSCTNLGTVTGSAWDSIAGLAYEFGDANDGVSSAAGVGAETNLTASPTAVTDKCVATPAKAKNTATGGFSGLTSGHPTLTLNIKTGTAFKSVTVGLPGGLKFTGSKTVAKEVSAAKVKSVKIAGGKLVIVLKSSVKSLTIKTKSGLISESTGLIKSIKKHKTKKLTVSIKAGSASIKASLKA